MAYDAAKARVFNEAIQFGMSPADALVAAGIDANDIGSYTVDTVGTQATNDGFGQLTNAGFDATQPQTEPPEFGTVGEDDLVFLNTGQNLGAADEFGFVQGDTGLGILPEEQAVGVGDAPGEDDLVFLNTGENLGVTDEAGFVQSSTGLNVLPEDQPPGEIDGYPQDLTPDVAPSEPLGVEEAERQRALIEQARVQATLAAQRKQANDGDWRVKLRLGPAADYLYRDPEIKQDGILYPLAVTDGVVFPYTPQINSTYHANYSQYDLTHSNYRGYFYQNSYVGEINLTATFTAQDTNEANYLLAVIHFFRSVTKMFYGKDAQRGSPPPLVFLQGLGEFQFNLQPCVVSQFNYNLPSDVDYIRARSVSVAGSTQNLLYRRDRQNLPTNVFSGALERLRNAGLKKGAINTTPPAPPTFGVNRPTYVPTKIDITLVLLPVQTRTQISQQFSLKQYANGDLKEGGFW